MGIENYKSIFWALRFHGKMFFKALWVDVISVWQPMDNVIMVRWTVHGIPRVPWDSRGRFDGTSEYKLDKKGKIFEHRVDNTALNSPPKFQVLAVADIIQSLGCPSTPRPTYFETSSSSSKRTCWCQNFGVCCAIVESTYWARAWHLLLQWQKSWFRSQHVAQIDKGTTRLQVNN